MPDFIYLLETRLSAAQKSAVQHIRDAAREADMNVFLAGGAVRDMISGFPVRDLDFSVQGGTAKLKRPLEKAGAAQWGAHAETHTLFYWFPGSVRVEISGTRQEEYPKPGKAVYHHATMLEDLHRRDFTANAMAISLNEGSYGLLLDPTNGIADIENRQIRLVSNYGFIEEPSRMVRAVRLATRTGWEMDERSRARYENAKEDGVIQYLSPYLRGYELEEIGHEEDALKALRALESEGWMEHLCAGWTSARADVSGLESLHQLYVKFLMQGVHPDLAAAQMRLLTAKMPPKDLAGLKKLLPCRGFVDQWEHLDEAAKEFAARLTSKDVTLPSEIWKLIANYQPEPVLWLAFTSKSSTVQSKFENFFEVWPEARQKIPTQLMAEMRITADMPEYGNLLNEIFFALIDTKLETEEAMRGFLEPYSPPAPPPPASVRRSRKGKSEARARLLQEEDRQKKSSGSKQEKKHAEEKPPEAEEHVENPEEKKAPRAVSGPKGAKAAQPAKAAGASAAKTAVKTEKTEKAAGKKESTAKAVAKNAQAKTKPSAKNGARPMVKKAPAKPAVKKAAPAKTARAKIAQPKPAARKALKKAAPARPVAKKAPKPVARKAATRPAAKKVVAKKAPAKPAAKKAAVKKKR